MYETLSAISECDVIKIGGNVATENNYGCGWLFSFRYISSGKMILIRVYILKLIKWSVFRYDEETKIRL